MRRSPHLVAVLLLAAAGAVETASAAEDPAALLRDWAALNSACRGGSGDDPRTQAACERRDAVDRALTDAGWCYGRPGEPGYQRAWRRCAAADPAGAGSGTPQGAERRALLDAARGPAEAGRRQPVTFLVRALNRDGPWAFLFARMQRPDGGPLARGRGADGPRSDDYAALLRREGDGWRVVASAIGPTDVAWEDWDRRYGAPTAVFSLP